MPLNRKRQRPVELSVAHIIVVFAIMYARGSANATPVCCVYWSVCHPSIFGEPAGMPLNRLSPVNVTPPVDVVLLPAYAMYSPEPVGDATGYRRFAHGLNVVEPVPVTEIGPSEYGVDAGTLAFHLYTPL